MVLILKCSTELLFMWAELLYEEQQILAYTHAIQEKVLQKYERKKRIIYASLILMISLLLPAATSFSIHD